jgi:hypothetical protein
MEEVDEEEGDTSRHNLAPLNKSRILELSDGTNNDEDKDMPALIPREDEDEDEDDEDEDEGDESDVEEPEESAEAELGLLNHVRLIAH